MKRLEEIERLVIVVDMVNGFIKFGNLADPYVNHITPNIIKLIEKTIEDEEGLAFIADNHEKFSTEFKKFLEHCVKGSGEEEVIDELKKYLTYALYFIKNSTSTIYAENFLETIKKMKNLKKVEIVGCDTDICILNLAIPLVCFFDENNWDVMVNVYRSMVETYDAPNHNRDEYNEMAFKLMKQAGVNVI